MSGDSWGTCLVEGGSNGETSNASGCPVLRENKDFLSWGESNRDRIRAILNFAYVRADMTDDWKARIDAYLDVGGAKVKRDRCNYPGCEFISRDVVVVPDRGYYGITPYIPGFTYYKGLYNCSKCSTPFCSDHIHKGICQPCAEKGLG
jgi:hypothetical protein